MHTETSDAQLLRHLAAHLPDLPVHTKERLVEIADHIDKIFTNTRNKAPWAEVIAAAVEFLQNDHDKHMAGLYKIRVLGELASRGDVADLLRVIAISKR